MSAGNPNHPVSRWAEGQWHKFLVLLMRQQGLTEVEITMADLEAVNADPAGTNIAVDTRGGRLVLRLLTDAEAEALARQEGGLPA